MSWISYGVIAFGVVLWLLLVLQMLLGYRTITFSKPATRLKVHRWVAWVLVVGGPIDGLLATSVFLGVPFKIG